MDVDKAVNIAYAENMPCCQYWKNFIGQIKMLRKNNVEEKKKALKITLSNGTTEILCFGKNTGMSWMTSITATNNWILFLSFFLFVYCRMRLDIVKFSGKFSGLKSALEKKDNAAIKDATAEVKAFVKENFKDEMF